jgi:hypothetical protein
MCICRFGAHIHIYNPDPSFLIQRLTQWNDVFVKLHGAPVERCEKVCLKNCHETLDKKWMVRILYMHQISMCT